MLVTGAVLIEGIAIIKKGMKVKWDSQQPKTQLNEVNFQKLGLHVIARWPHLVERDGEAPCGLHVDGNNETATKGLR